jgi:hypothetical protein
MTVAANGPIPADLASRANDRLKPIAAGEKGRTILAPSLIPVQTPDGDSLMTRD